MVARKRGGKQRASQKKIPVKPVIPCCTACHSPSVDVMVIHGKEQFVCRRCGHVSAMREDKPVDEVRQLHLYRNRHVHATARHRRYRRHQSFYAFLERFHLRLWFKILSTTFLGFGVVLLATTRPWTGALFLVIGVVGFTTSFRFFR
ncbi:hypothetical protein GF367_01325 [Candidatus Woesearchaeota archaeon]|nr:hypothetical protein [Candidatus Woesearchaeota archaeon]